MLFRSPARKPLENMMRALREHTGGDAVAPLLEKMNRIPIPKEMSFFFPSISTWSTDIPAPVATVARALDTTDFPTPPFPATMRARDAEKKRRMSMVCVRCAGCSVNQDRMMVKWRDQ